MTRLKAPFLYFLLVYLAGFALGTAREFLVTPAVGLTNALLIETTIMVVLCLFAARFVLDRTPEAKTPGDGLALFTLMPLLIGRKQAHGKFQ